MDFKIAVLAGDGIGPEISTRRDFSQTKRFERQRFFTRSTQSTIPAEKFYSIFI